MVFFEGFKAFRFYRKEKEKRKKEVPAPPPMVGKDAGRIMEEKETCDGKNRRPADRLAHPTDGADGSG